MNRLSCFKAYDVRGKLGRELNESIVYRIGRAYAEILNPRHVVIGADIRLSSESFKQAFSDGLVDSGVDVLDLGTTGTEEVYFATSYLKVDGGIQVTASHNPINYNGLKFVCENSKPLSQDSLREIQKITEENVFDSVEKRGKIKNISCLPSYINHLISYIEPNNIKAIKLVVNAGNGAAGPVVDALETTLKEKGMMIDFIKINHQPDGCFPKGVPNPMLPENRSETSKAVIMHNADMGIAWDGDFDRCFLFDDNGRFIESYYIVGLLAEAFLRNNPKSNIIHDPRLIWNTIDIVINSGGTPIQSKTGHTFIKESMRKEDAIYGGEMSGHHYFKDFAYCDSGMIPWLLIIGLLSDKNIPLSKMVEERIIAYPSSGELNFSVKNQDEIISKIFQQYKSKAKVIDKTDGISFEFEEWRFNLRSSNTEDVIRLNVETKGNLCLLREKTAEVEKLICN